MGDTTIAWTNKTWNSWIGCSRVSPGCDNCYMFEAQARYGGNPDVVKRTARQTFNAPLKWKDASLIFTCSWSDFFHQKADTWREEAWEIILNTPQHTYQILTKRPGRAVAWAKAHPFPDNVWVGTSVESQKYAPRVEVLLRIPAAIHFVSMEPLLSSVNLVAEHLQSSPSLDWVITGGESGPKRRQAQKQWFTEIRNQCKASGIAYFHKRGNALKPGQDRELDGRTWDEMPASRR